jgi:transposase
VNGAVNIDSLETVCRFYDTINGAAMIDLCKAIEERYPKAGTIHIICDNARYYRSKEARKFLETSRIKLVFLPPYAPNLNLIERYWRYFKKIVLYNHYYETFNDFKTACENFFSESEKHVDDLRSLLSENFQIIGA